MTSRIQDEQSQILYQAAEKWVDAALRSDGSLFTPGSPVWTLEAVGDFHHRFVVNEDVDGGSFNERLHSQLDNAGDTALQLASELLYFHSLGIFNQSASVTRALVSTPLEMMAQPIEVPPELQTAFSGGIAHVGPALAWRWAHICYLTLFVKRWKEDLSEAERVRLLEDPWAFRDEVFSISVKGAATQQHLFLHLVYPDIFEPIGSEHHKRLIVNHWADRVNADGANLDEALSEIRQALKVELGRDVDYYESDTRKLWQPPTAAPTYTDPDAVAAVRSMVERFLPDGDVRGPILARGAQVAIDAHELNARSWSIGVGTGHRYLAISVGRLAVFYIYSDRVLVSLDTSHVGTDLQARLDTLLVDKSREFASMPGVRYWTVPSESLPDLLTDMDEALTLATTRAAQQLASIPVARFHSHAAIEYLRAETGLDVPEPEYDPGLPRPGWGEFISWAVRLYDGEAFDENERHYKLNIGENLRQAREAVFAETDWLPVLKRAFTKDSNLTAWQAHDLFLRWCESEQEAAREALAGLWSTEPVEQAMRSFLAVVPPDAPSGRGARTSIASFLRMVEPETYPIYRPTPFDKAFALTDQPGADNAWDEATTYTYALSFLDEMIERCHEAGAPLRDRLDAQSLLWMITVGNLGELSEDGTRLQDYRKSVEMGEVEESPSLVDIESWVEPPFEQIAAEVARRGLRIDTAVLRRFHLSLKTRGFVILSGVSGTGKSWLTAVYADAIGGNHHLIPVAPNWTTNEDLIGWLNPVIEAYVDTDFSRALRAAAKSSEDAEVSGVTAPPTFVVLDEMNLARVEYYFAKFLSAMEARSQGDAFIELAPGEHVALPSNLYVIGTVNVDETTHGFADKVYDRAQVIELPITEDDIALHLGDASHRHKLLEIWRAVAPVAPFAFRVVDEIASYMRAAEDLSVDWTEALDHQILQKVLPKLARPDLRVAAALAAVIEICGDSMPLSRDKARAMKQGIDDHGFASYF